MYAHDDLIDISIFVCSIDDTFGAIHTPIILEASEGVVSSISCGNTGV